MGSGTLSNTATVDAATPDGNGANDSATEATTVRPSDYAEAGCEPGPNGVLLQGGGADDKITGTNDDDQIKGGGGDDKITGLKGDDCLFGQ